MSEPIQTLAERVAAAIKNARQSTSQRVGTLVDRQLVRLRECGGHKADCVIACLDAIRAASLSNPEFAKLHRAVRRDGAVDLWLTHPSEPWRCAAFQISFQAGFKPTELFLVVSTHLPFGEAGDTSAYPVELSTAYQRGTQEVRPVVSLQQRRIVRTSSQSARTEDHGVTASKDIDRQERSTNGQVHSTTLKWTRADVRGKDEVAHYQYGWNSPPNRAERTKRATWSEDSATEQKQEHSSAYHVDHTHSSRTREEDVRRSSTNRVEDDVIEFTQDISFVAVGPDFTNAERLWAAWRSDPANQEASTLVDVILASVAGLGEVIEEAVGKRRLRARDDASEVYGDTMDAQFWHEIEGLAPVDLDGSIWPRVQLAHDGAIRPITREDMEQAAYGCGLQLTPQRDPPKEPAKLDYDRSHW